MIDIVKPHYFTFFKKYNECRNPVKIKRTSAFTKMNLKGRGIMKMTERPFSIFFIIAMIET